MSEKKVVMFNPFRGAYQEVSLDMAKKLLDSVESKKVEIRKLEEER